MTDREKAIVMAHTGIAMLVGDKFGIFHEYIESLLGRPIYTHELACEEVWNEIKEKSKNDFLKICADTEKPHGEWIIIGEEQGACGMIYKIRKCNNCGWEHSLVIPDNFCPNCGADMRGNNR